MSARRSRALPLALVAALVFSLGPVGPVPINDAWAGGKSSVPSAGGRSSSSSSPSSTWTSKSSAPRTSPTLWDRSVPYSGGGGVSPPASSGGYAKPALATPSQPTAAPATPVTHTPVAPAPVTPAPAAAAAPAKPAPSSGGYAKPALAIGAGVGIAAGVAATTGLATPSGAKAAPSLADSPHSDTPRSDSGRTESDGPGPATSSGGYSKPAGTGPSAPAPSPATSAPPSPTPIASTPSVTPPAPALALPATAPVSSGGYSKPPLPGAAASPPSAATTPATTSAAAAATAATRPDTGFPSAATAAPPLLTPPSSGLDRGAERQLATQSLARYKAEQDRFKAPPQGTLTNSSEYTSNPLYNSGAGRYKSYDQAYAERDIFRNSHPWSPPAYAYQSAPSFGMWDGLFWWMVLDKITEPSYAATAYHNQNDPGFQAWRREADRMAQDNAELKGKLAAMDARVAALQGQPLKPGTLPDGVSPATALAPTVAVAPRDRSVLVVGTGSTSGHYYPFCQGEGAMKGLRGHLSGLPIQCKVTNGSVENLDNLVVGNYDAILVQSDVLNEWLVQHPGRHLDALKATLYQEYVQVLANKQAGVNRIGDVDPERHTVYLVGSGAQKTWDSFASLVPRYATFEQKGRLRRVPGDAKILEIVAGNPNAVMVFVAGLNSDLLRRANDQFGDRLTMALVDDDRLDDRMDPTGHPIYAYAKIPSGVYPNLQRSRWFGLTSSVPSLSVGAVFILSERWVTENGVAGLSKVEEALWQTIPEIEKRVGVGG